MPEFPFFYKTATIQNCIDETRDLFTDITSETIVEGKFEVDFEGMVEVHNHMNSSTTWKHVSQWNSGIYYTIDHPDGDIIASDLNRGEDTEVFKQELERMYWGSTGDKSIHFTISRHKKKPLGSSLDSIYIKNCKWVKIESKKSFEYVSARSSWIFNLAVVWEGRTKKEAESSPKKYIVTLSPGSNSVKSSNPGYTAASFMEKLMDSLFKTSKNRHIMLTR